MKITLYKVLSYWKEGKEADFDKETRYDNNIFELFKDKLETKEQIVKSREFHLFIYRKSSGMEDFKERPIDLVAGLYADNQFRDPEKVYNLIQEQVDVFDEKLEYIVEVDDSLLALRRRIVNKDIIVKSKLITGIIVIFFILALGMYLYIQSSAGNELKKNTSLLNEDNITIDKLSASKKKSHKQAQPKIVKWKWDTFCKDYEIKKPGFCHETYIEEKCKKKNDFKISYKKYMKLHTDIRSCRYGDEDQNLKEAMRENRSIKKEFFKGVKR